MKRSTAAFLSALLILVVPAIILAVDYYHTWQHWLSYATGSYNTPPGIPHNYSFFSGSGSDISELSIFAALVILVYHIYKKHNCHEDKCWRIGTHPVGKYIVCKKHHGQVTGDKVTIDHLKKHHAYQNRIEASKIRKQIRKHGEPT